MTVKGEQLRIIYKNPCRVATTANIAVLAGGAPSTVDGVTLSVGDRVLVKDQTASAENGIYVVDTVGTGSNGSWSRSLDMDDVVEDEIVAGLSTYIQEGTLGAKNTFTLTTTGTIVLGTTGLLFEDLFNATGSIGGSTGSLNEAILVADGVGGSTLKATTVTIDPSGNVLSLASLGLIQQALGPTVTAGTGAFWVRDDLLPAPVFTEGDSGTEYHLLNFNPVKRPCRVATTGDIPNTATGAPDVVDGVSLAVGDRILVWQQNGVAADPENGIYTVTSVGTGADGVWTRADDWDDGTKDHLAAGNEVYIQEGNTHGRTRFTLVTTGPIAVGTTAVEFISGGALVRSDVTEIVDSTGNSFTASQATATFSSPINVTDYTDVDVYMEITTLGSITELTVFAQSTGVSGTPASTDWGDLQSDDAIAAGIVTLADYLPKNDTAAVGTFHWNFPARGTQMRFGVFANTTGGAYNLKYKRNVR